MTHPSGSIPKKRHDFSIQWELAPFEKDAFQGVDLPLSQPRLDDDWFRAFWYAAYGGRVETMKKIATILPIVQLVLYVLGGDQALHAAAKKAQIAVMEWLSQKGCHIDMRNKRGETPLICLLLEKDEIPEEERKESAQVLLRLGALPDLSDHSGNTARSLLHARGWDIIPPPSREQRVFQAVDGVNSDELAEALKEFEPNQGCCRNPTGRTPFHVLLVMGKRASLLKTKEKMVGQLAEVFDINAKDGADSTALFAAVAGLEYQFAKFLLQHNANPNLLSGNLLSGKNQEAPLHRAPTSAFVKLLVSYKADPNIRQKPLQKTPLHTAARAGRVGVIQALLKAGADSGLRDHLGNTVLHECPNVECAQPFLKCPDLVNAQNELGETPLHKAIRRETLPTTRTGNLALITALLDAGANLRLKTRMERQAPLQFARELSTFDDDEIADTIKRIIALLKAREENSCILS